MEKIDWKAIKKHLIIVSIIFNFVFLGGIFNSLAFLENGCKMPVYTSFDYSTETHFSFNNPGKINNFIFTDIFCLENFLNYEFICLSIGDALMVLGLIVLITFSIIFILKIWRYKHV